MAQADAPAKSPNAFQRGVNAVIDLLSSFFLPIINLLVSVGILKGILTLLQVAGVVTDASTTYAILNAMADSLFYFIPVFLAYTASKRFGVDTVTGILLGCILLYPSITTIMAGSDPVTLFGIPIAQATYSSSVIPILLAIYCASWVQKACYHRAAHARDLWSAGNRGRRLARPGIRVRLRSIPAYRRCSHRRVPAVPRHPGSALGAVPHRDEQCCRLRFRYHHGALWRSHLRTGRRCIGRRAQDQEQEVPFPGHLLPRCWVSPSPLCTASTCV